jgi:hypothetical protein
MVDGERGTDSFEVVKGFVKGLGDRRPDPWEVQKIAPALNEIYQRLMRVRSYAPRVDLSDHMWDLMEMVGIRARRSGGDEWIRKAAVL